MTFSTTRSKLPHICVTFVTEYQISIRSALQTAVPELQDILKQLHLMNSKLTNVLHICVTSVSESTVAIRFVQ